MIYCWVKSFSVWCIVLGKVISLVKLGQVIVCLTMLGQEVVCMKVLGQRVCLFSGVRSRGCLSDRIVWSRLRLYIW